MDLLCFFLSYGCNAFVCVCSYVPCGRLLGKVCPLGSRLWCLAVSLLLSHCYPGSGVVLDCIDSRSMHPSLLTLNIFTMCSRIQIVYKQILSWMLVSSLAKKANVCNYFQDIPLHMIHQVLYLKAVSPRS